MRSRPRSPLVVALAAAALLGTACANERTAHAPEHDRDTSAEVTRADVTFARDMVPHHEQAVVMADLVADRTDDPAVTDLAERIRQAQQPEIDRLEGWLNAWDAAEPPAQQGEPSARGGQHGGPGSDEGRGGHAAGMMSGADMAALHRTSGAEFDRMWLEMMIEHHRGAVDMARAELADGTHPGAREMARSIIDGQQDEIDEMRGVLDAG